VKKGWNVNIMVSALHEDLYTGGSKSGYLPFGLGNKRCPGEAFALSSSATILETIFANFNLSVTGGSPELGFIPGLRPAASGYIKLTPNHAMSGGFNNA
jgi:cytochrome P450